MGRAQGDNACSSTVALSASVGWGMLEGKKNSDVSDADKCLVKGMMCCAFSHKSRPFQNDHYILTFIALYR